MTTTTPIRAHRAQKPFGSSRGHGLDATASGFESTGLRQGQPAAALAGPRHASAAPQPHDDAAPVEQGR